MALVLNTLVLRVSLVLRKGSLVALVLREVSLVQHHGISSLARPR